MKKLKIEFIKLIRTILVILFGITVLLGFSVVKVLMLCFAGINKIQAILPEDNEERKE